jgi:RNA polymerase sigma-70 factor (ECF subfamily)
MQNTLTMTNPKDLASHLATKLAEDKTQDSADFALLVSQHSQVLYRIAMAVARNSHDAEDIVQESFLQLYRTRNWPEINDQRAYLARVAWRLAVRRHNHKSRPIHQELSLDLQSREITPENAAIDDQRQAQIHAMLDQLPENLRQPLALAALGDLKLVEIAVMLNLPEGTVRRRIHTARQKLKEQLAASLKQNTLKGGTAHVELK